MLDNLVAQLQSYRGIWRQQKFIELIDHQVEIPFNQKRRMDARKILIQRIADLRTLFMPGIEAYAADNQRKQRPVRNAPRRLLLILICRRRCSMDLSVISVLPV